MAGSCWTLVAVGAALLLAPGGLANSVHPYPGQGPVLAGYDVVAYFSLAPGADGVKGSPAINSTYQSASFYFASRANKAKFDASPEAFLPQYGGFCAWGVCCELPGAGWPWSASHLMGQGGPPAGPVDGWAVVDGKLYFTINREYMTRFLAGDQGAAHIAAATTRWTSTWGFNSTTSGPIDNKCYAWSYKPCM